MRVSIITALFFSLASFTHAQYYDVDFDARAMDDVLERREILDGLSTRELVNELSARLDDRLSRRAPDKKQPNKRGVGLRHDPVYKCPGCGQTFATEAETSKIGSRHTKTTKTAHKHNPKSIDITRRTIATHRLFSCRSAVQDPAPHERKNAAPVSQVLHLGIGLCVNVARSERACAVAYANDVARVSKRTPLPVPGSGGGGGGGGGGAGGGGSAGSGRGGTSPTAAPVASVTVVCARDDDDADSAIGLSESPPFTSSALPLRLSPPEDDHHPEINTLDPNTDHCHPRPTRTRNRDFSAPLTVSAHPPICAHKFDTALDAEKEVMVLRFSLVFECSSMPTSAFASTVDWWAGRGGCYVATLWKSVAR
ncbi:hypothetical protein DFP72DRAFT_1081832 [Ephemerocybe angulata]|uniref:C2H2-type domain-containing protein n=1 Tax=Ephemerocybe angulata TaxID=980116 RepID=A0A8H6H8U9_9AGAR|nr:hypothetical protein DFP72DRAFT_1081832 [Tulosesus angulatus]